jgi:hypothetical protein
MRRSRSSGRVTVTRTALLEGMSARTRMRAASVTSGSCSIASISRGAGMSSPPRPSSRDGRAGLPRRCAPAPGWCGPHSLQPRRNRDYSGGALRRSDPHLPIATQRAPSSPAMRERGSKVGKDLRFRFERCESDRGNAVDPHGESSGSGTSLTATPQKIYIYSCISLGGSHASVEMG